LNVSRSTILYLFVWNCCYTAGEKESAERVTEGIEKIDFEVYVFEEED